MLKIFFNGRAIAVGVALSVLCGTSAEIHAQSRSIDAHFFRPALFSRGIFAVDRAGRALKWQPSFKFYFNHESAPLNLTFLQEKCGGKCLGTQRIIDHSQVFNVQAQFGLTRWLELALDIPFSRQTFVTSPGGGVDQGMGILTAGDPKTNVQLPQVSPLDVRVGLKFSLFELGRVGLALAVQGTVPFGDEEYFAGARGATVHPRLLAGVGLGPVSIAINGGYWLRQRTVLEWDDPATAEGPIPLLSLADEITFGAGVLYRLWRYMSVGAELIGAVPVRAGGTTDVVTARRLEPDTKKCPAGTPAGAPCELIETRKANVPGASVVMEGLGGLVFTPTPGLDVAVGAGAGIVGNERRVALRMFVGLTWAPGAKESVSDRDRDRDGVPDSRDECPDQAEDKDGFQDEDGCPDKDNDGDGLADAQDKCANEPEDKDGFQDEDGCPDKDNDGDGIPDAQDKCPSEPEDKDGFQDEDGCPDKDNDGDGIADAQDKCANEPETSNGYQDDDGCPDSVPTGVAVAKGKLEIKEQIQFKAGTAILDSAIYRVLDEIAKTIQANPQIGTIRIEGHTDNTGSTAANKKLSEDRAAAVKAYLVRKGVGTRLLTVGYGATKPIAPNDTAEGRNKNRRVELIIVQTKEPKRAP